ncbi:Integrase, catalytic region [Alkaliphilus metalliredigens QYMF]|uniref:Integrase, catalytic region n=2 Tax=Alkaliphilus TaxID=114627 RepID=A6TM43_ALKMQ|nr:Integrase, catalytic region [Alkaliphilus metalliredigens QYMF]ABR47669.1 Integrase, catalytic region [Alkaliphilus metalliredigens QYMF]ABR47937.1 Integrase, catalytic region [Alkaliphilus metalliredigens QYMF]ABR48273.1 Integrase, catalytic region [Alkaliphilus metalliredigens QYMF]ABR48996.1 Integrase, catalytic region [Alkaliphilus metalliredigens QYMF]
MFAEIQGYKSKGLNKSQVARRLEIDYKTVHKYWDMTPDEFASLRQRTESRERKVDKYKDEVLAWIREHRDLSSAQIYDWLEEKYHVLDFKDRTLRLYVNHLREEHKLPKVVSARQFEEVDELPMGYQAQVDLGQIWLDKPDKTRIKVYCFGMVLSHSRHKYIYWIDKPFTTQTFIEAHNKAFEYFGGMPKEVVYDQDRVLVVSENHGDIIYTEGFQNYINSLKFKVYLCRGYDPQSKGKIEAVVKYAKYNFAKNRTFVDIDSFNDDSLKWLERRGNKKVHETTKKVPAEVFALEKEHLKPIPTLFVNTTNTNSLTYLVRKNNTVFYKQNRYQVPTGTYSPGKEVKLIIKKDTMEIKNQDTEQLIIEHKISQDKGKLVKIEHYDRNESKHCTSHEIYNKVLKSLDHTEKANEFVDVLKIEKPRHFKDQFALIMNTVKNQDKSIVQRALSYCIERKLFSAGLLKDAIQYLKLEENRQLNKKYFKADITTPSKYQDLKPQVRDIREYMSALKEDKRKWKN